MSGFSPSSEQHMLVYMFFLVTFLFPSRLVFICYFIFILVMSFSEKWFDC